MSAAALPGGRRAGAGVGPRPAQVEAAPSLELGLRLTLLGIALDPPLLWLERMPLLLLAGLGLAVPSALRSRALWAALLAAAAWPLVWQWPFSDNHDYLTALWCLAVACALSATDPARALAHHARRLVGLSFAFAVLWKVALAPDFLDGRFMRVTLVSDGRFENLAVLAGVTTHDEWARNDLALDAYLSGEATWEESGFREPPGLRALAGGLTAATLAMEAAVALGFLWPLGRGPSRFRNAFLLLFTATTYSFATVRGFGWLLASLGAAQAERRAARVGYLAAFALVALYRSVPWSRFLIERLH